MLRLFVPAGETWGKVITLTNYEVIDDGKGVQIVFRCPYCLQKTSIIPLLPGELWIGGLWCFCSCEKGKNLRGWGWIEDKESLHRFIKEVKALDLEPVKRPVAENSLRFQTFYERRSSMVKRLLKKLFGRR